MKMVKSLLLGSAAGMLAVAGAQAADLPVKAKPVEYVKVCSLYGAGFYYMPGTDICIKIGGFVRYQATWNGGNNVNLHSFGGTHARHTRVDTDNLNQRARAIVTFDTRQQTAYGTLRTYTMLGFTHDTNRSGFNQVYATRAFIQIAGFTLGRTTSYYDIFPSASYAYNAGPPHSSDNGDAGNVVFAYTAQFGNGMSATLSAESARSRSVVNTTAIAAGGMAIGTALTTATGGSNAPDIVGNLRMDQAWGSAQIMGALHQVRGQYFSAAANAAGNVNGGHPDDKWGYAIGAGVNLNLPMIAPGDRFSIAGNYTVGAPAYASLSGMNGAGMYQVDGGSVGVGYAPDAVYGGILGAGTATGLQLTTAWSVAAAFEHLWTPALKTSVFGGYVDVSYNTTANGLLCAGLTWNAGGATCNMDWSAWALGTRTQWTPTRGLIVGLEVVYQEISTATTSTGFAPFLAAGGRPAGAYTLADQESLGATFRVQRDFLP